MRWFFRPLACIAFHTLGIAINILNSFAQDIIIYEATEGISFDWNLLFSNKFFWFLFFIQVVYGIASAYANYKNNESDRQVAKAIDNCKINLIDQVSDFTKVKDFDSAKEVLEILDKIDERGNK